MGVWPCRSIPSDPSDPIKDGGIDGGMMGQGGERWKNWMGAKLEAA